jgi:hypothetical protein
MTEAAGEVVYSSKIIINKPLAKVFDDPRRRRPN